MKYFSYNEKVDKRNNRNIYIFYSLLEFYFSVIWYASKEIFQSEEFFPYRIFLCLSRVVADFLRTMLDFAQIKSVSGGFFCELFATCCRWTIDWLPCGLRVVFFVTYQGREYLGMHLEQWSMILVGTLSYYISCFTSLCNKKRRACTNLQSVNLKNTVISKRG